jgi:hypothetical protein
VIPHHEVGLVVVAWSRTLRVVTVDEPVSVVVLAICACSDGPVRTLPRNARRTDLGSVWPTGIADGIPIGDDYRVRQDLGRHIVDHRRAVDDAVVGVRAIGLATNSIVSVHASAAAERHARDGDTEVETNGATHRSLL